VITIDGPEALELLKTAVAEKGAGYVYEEPAGSIGCRYADVENDEPSCIVGNALHRKGITVATLDEMDRADLVHEDDVSSTTISQICTLDTAALYGFELTDSARGVFATAQAQQDSRVPWGRAVALAAEELAG
jgi:hypothetical protein